MYIIFYNIVYFVTLTYFGGFWLLGVCGGGGLFIYFICVSIFPAFIYVPDSCKAQKRALDPLALELQMVMSCHVGARN